MSGSIPDALELVKGELVAFRLVSKSFIKIGLQFEMAESE